MADTEYFILDPGSPGATYTNLEAADDAAQKLASEGSADCVAIVRCTTTTVRRYRRTVTITPEDVPPT
ncbi:hypothetical protein [Streptomyces misionensis]|uniref:hypothetical protein n=1 Tax=Streptomyces misionensis TaxID=67331 RepID=UPI003683C1A3